MIVSAFVDLGHRTLLFQALEASLALEVPPKKLGSVGGSLKFPLVAFNPHEIVSPTIGEPRGFASALTAPHNNLMEDRMTQERALANGGASRRDFLVAAAAVGGATLVGFASSPAEAAKMSQKAMAYRPSPNGNQRCDNCANFEPPAGCKLLDGSISPAGWCILYRAK
jgi:hypothetical protein